MRILVATDAWRPQINGVVRTYERVLAELDTLGVETAVLAPDEFRTFPCPTYPEIRLAVPGYSHVVARLDLVRPDAVHIATEGPVGWMARAYCLKRNIPFTTSFHTRFPDYLKARFGFPVNWTYALQRLFHNAGAGMMVATDSLARDLDRRGFRRIFPWTRGVDTQLFRPRHTRSFGEGTVFLYVGRVAVEKNLPAFLDLDLPGRKVVVGVGPMLDELRARYPGVLFTGALSGDDLAEAYASADVFVFPSRTDTFGMVLLEAMASGLPVAAYPVTGPIDLVQPTLSGFLDEDLGRAARSALALDRSAIRGVAERFGWQACARLFLQNIEAAVLAKHGRRTNARPAIGKAAQGAG
jgi:glycosyltransferase involved in cell wall biosynthesis